MALAPERFFLASPRPQPSQGDVYLAPATTVWSGLSMSAPPTIPQGPRSPGQSIATRAWELAPAAHEHTPEVTLATSWGPVIVISHDCEIDKEFNEYVDALMKTGVSEDDAISQATARDDLDRFILVSPLLPYAPEVVAEERWESIRSAQKIGYFPIPAIPGFGEAEYLLHLSRISTVERRLLVPRYKAASLGDDARALLRFKLAEALASRNLSLVSKREAAIGRRLEDVRTLKTKRQDATVALVWDDGTELQVAAKAGRDAAVSERNRVVLPE